MAGESVRPFVIKSWVWRRGVEMCGVWGSDTGGDTMTRSCQSPRGGEGARTGQDRRQVLQGPLRETLPQGLAWAWLRAGPPSSIPAMAPWGAAQGRLLW